MDVNINFNLLTKYYFHYDHSAIILTDGLTSSSPIKVLGTTPLIKIISHGVVKLVSVVGFSEQIAVNMESLKNAFVQLLRLPPHTALTHKTLDKLASSEDVPAFAQGLSALSKNWNLVIADIAQQKSFARLSLAQDLLRALHTGIEGLIKNQLEQEAEPLWTYVETTLQLIDIKTLIQEVVGNGNSQAARLLLDLVRELQSLSTGLEARQNRLPGWSLLQAQLKEAIPLSIRQLARALVADAAASKGIAFRAGVDQLIHNVKSTGITPNKKVRHSDVYIGKHAVIKHCDKLAAEEEALAEGLGQIFDPELYTPQAPLMDLVKLGITLQDCSRPSIMMDDLPGTLGWGPAKPGHLAVIKPTINNLLLLSKVEDDETENILTSRLASFASELKSVRVLYVQPLDLHASNIGFRPILAPHHALYEDALFSYDEKSARPLSKVMRDYLKGLAHDTEMEILFANGERTSAKICDHPGLVEALNSPWELEFFDMDKSLYETNDLISMDSNAIPPLLYDLAELDFAHRPLSQIAIEKLMADGKKIPEALRYLKKDYHPLLMRMENKAKSRLRTLLDNYLSSYRLGIQFIKPTENLTALRDQFANELARDPSNEIWHCLDPVYQAAHPNSFPLSHPQMHPKRLEVAAQLFPRATIAQQNAFKERMERQSRSGKLHENF